MTVSCDLNYRRSLWSWCKDQAGVMKEMVAISTIVIANEEHLELLLGFTGPVALRTEKMLHAFENIQAVAVTKRFSNASLHGWTACLRDRNEFAEGRRYEIPHIVDRIGAGDAFAAGLIYGWNCLETHRDALDFALAAGCLKHSIPGDFCRLTVDEVNALRNEGRSGQVER